MSEFAKQRGIELRKAPPFHPSANPVETFMKPLGKAMKVAHANNVPEKEALNEAILGYRQTPHPATGTPHQV